MKVTRAEFVKSALLPRDCPGDGRPEFAFTGRSNVGKSTLLNTLMQRKGLAKTSGTPGKTQTLNFFLVNERFYFVDLPGYGYAKAPRSLQAQWGEHMTRYLMTRAPLRMAAALVDARHKPTDQDLEMLALLEAAETPTVVVATKIDKLKRGQRKPQLALIRSTLELEEDALIIPFSGVTGEGAKALLEVIGGFL